MFQLTNVQQSIPDSRDFIANLPIVEVLPAAIDLKPSAREVENQLQFNSCTANAGCSALELMYTAKGLNVNLSRFFLYFYERQLSSLTGDAGAYPRDIGKALKQYGVCYESSWQYLQENLNTVPSDSANTEAATFKIVSYESLTGDKLTQIKNALAQGIPVLLNIEVHKGFMAVRGDWKKHAWDWNTTTDNPSLGWHEVLVIGYDDVSQHLLIENSWGIAWGDLGFGGIPYSMIDTPSFGELWILNPNYDMIGNITPPPLPAPVEPEKKSKLPFIIISTFIIGVMVLSWMLH